MKHLSPWRLADYLEPNWSEIDCEFTPSFCLAAYFIHAGIEPQNALELNKNIVSLGTGVLKTQLWTRSEVCDNKLRNVAMVGVGFLAYYLRRMLKYRDANTSLDQESTRFIRPPGTSNIPFANMMKLPLPFQPDARQLLPACHLPIMTSKSFLETGSWEGYYAYSFDRRPDFGRFDPPMRDIVLHGIGTTKEDVQDLEGEGIDAIGRFRVRGEIWNESGRILACKTYVGSLIYWKWDACMTPFGIVGTWGRIEWGGWFWLWKTDWARASG